MLLFSKFNEAGAFPAKTGLLFILKIPTKETQKRSESAHTHTYIYVYIHRRFLLGV